MIALIQSNIYPLYGWSKSILIAPACKKGYFVLFSTMKSWLKPNINGSESLAINEIEKVFPGINFWKYVLDANILFPTSIPPELL